MHKSLSRSFHATVLKSAAEEAWMKFQKLPPELQEQAFKRQFAERAQAITDATDLGNLAEESQKRAKILMAEKNGMPQEMIERYLV